jgi:hypothetical protein
LKINPSALIAVLALLLNFVPRSGAAAEQEAKPDPLQAVAESYLDALCEQDFGKLAGLMDPKILFEDPTLSLFSGEGLSIEGRDGTLAHLQRNAKKAAKSAVDVRESFVSGEHVVMRLNYVTKGSQTRELAERGNAGFRLGTSAVTILRIKQGRVVHHLDHVDYASILRKASGEDK